MNSTKGAVDGENIRRAFVNGEQNVITDPASITSTHLSIVLLVITPLLLTNRTDLV